MRTNVFPLRAVDGDEWQISRSESGQWTAVNQTATEEIILQIGATLEQRLNAFLDTDRQEIWNEYLSLCEALASLVARASFPRIRNFKSPVRSAEDWTSEPCRILEYWRAVELFTVQTAPKVDSEQEAAPIYSVRSGEPPPWHEEHWHLLRPIQEGRKWRYTVYVGLFEQALVTEKLKEAFEKGKENYEEGTEGQCSVFTVTLDHEAQPLLETFVLSSAAWSMGRLIEPGPGSADWLTGFDEVVEHLRNYLGDTYAQLATGGQPRATASSLFKIMDRMLRFMNFPLVCERELRVRCTAVTDNAKASTDDPLNSFYLRDLRKVTRAILTKNTSSPLSTYLTPDAALSLGKRLDVAKQSPVALCWEKLRPTLFPKAKWPTPGDHPLVYSQQMAVNELASRLKKEGLFSINGPPGTGKTTLLRDVISSIVVDRAERLAKLKKPSDGFQKFETWPVLDFKRRANFLIESLTGFEIVVASANNGAVENVTLELPLEDSIDGRWKKELEYFSEFATNLLKEKKAWGLIAAKLGSKENRNEFLWRFWKDHDDKDRNKIQGFKTFLKSLEGEADRTPPERWQQAVECFNRAVAEEEKIRRSRDVAWTAYRECKIQKDREVNLASRSLELQQNCRTLEQRRATEWEHVLRCERAVERAKLDRKENLQFRPTFWQILFSWGGALQVWTKEDEDLKSRIKIADDAWNDAHIRCSKILVELHHAESRRKESESELFALRSRISSYEEQIATAERDLGKHFVPNNTDWANNVVLRECSAPWADKKWNDARVRVFIAALQLHKAFILGNAKMFRQNFDVLEDIFQGNVRGASTEAIISVWNSLFLLVPVVSTTFASFDRLFSRHMEASLGWLFIDEAGQSTPQAAVGALWRARRAIVVGDPLQLEPIISLPASAQNALREGFSVPETWLTCKTSCQGLADRTSPLGTYLETTDDPIWVGSPLRVHRRCDDPMFSIANKVAYGGTRVFGTPHRGTFIDLPSGWIDVRSDVVQEHWIPEEGRVILMLLDHLIERKGIDSRAIFLISPFRTVARQAQSLVQQNRDYKGVQTGTIHRVQGKESDVVIFILGGDPKKKGAKQWASSKPNLVNVAVSRSKRRLYIVGNHGGWSTWPYFSVIAKIPILPIRQLQEE